MSPDPDIPENIYRRLDLANVFRKYHRNINKGIPYHLILDQVFDDLKNIIPFERIGIALVDEDKDMIRFHWVKSELPVKWLKEDYAGNYKKSSLKKVIDSREPRIINDLDNYFISHPDSINTNLALRDGIRSNLTCPLIHKNIPIGVVFFSSSRPNTYKKFHIDMFNEVAEELSLLVSEQTIRVGKKFSGLVREIHTTCNYFKKRFAEIETEDFERPLAKSLEELISEINTLSKEVDFRGKIINPPHFLKSITEHFNDNYKRIKIGLNIGSIPDKFDVDGLALHEALFNLMHLAMDNTLSFSQFAFEVFERSEHELVFQVSLSSLTNIDLNKFKLPEGLMAEKFIHSENDGTSVGFVLQTIKS